MSETNKIAAFFKVLEASIEENGFISLTLSKPKDKHSLVKNIYLRPILLQSEEMIQMVIKYPTREETKNLSVPDFLAFLSLSLQSHFGYAHVLLKNQEGHLLVSNRGFVTLKWKKTTLEAFKLPIHDKEKQYIVST